MVASESRKLTRNHHRYLRLPVPHWLIGQHSSGVWAHVLESRNQSRCKPGVGFRRKRKIDEIAIYPVVVTPEALLKTQSRSKPVHIQVGLVDNKTSAANPAKRNIPPSVGFDHFGGLILELATKNISGKSAPDGFFSF